jgi:hypothetical protein
MTQAQISRLTRDLCQVCWQDFNPGEYCPDLNRYGTCAECGCDALVVRSTIRFEARDEPDPRSLTPDDCPGGRCYGHHAEPTR